MRLMRMRILLATVFLVGCGGGAPITFVDPPRVVVVEGASSDPQDADSSSAADAARIDAPASSADEGNGTKPGTGKPRADAGASSTPPASEPDAADQADGWVQGIGQQCLISVCPAGCNGAGVCLSNLPPPAPPVCGGVTCSNSCVDGARGCTPADACGCCIDGKCV